MDSSINQSVDEGHLTPRQGSGMGLITFHQTLLTWTLLLNSLICIVGPHFLTVSELGGSSSLSVCICSPFAFCFSPSYSVSLYIWTFESPCATPSSMWGRILASLPWLSELHDAVIRFKIHAKMIRIYRQIEAQVKSVVNRTIQDSIHGLHKNDTNIGESQLLHSTTWNHLCFIWIFLIEKQEYKIIHTF